MHRDHEKLAYAEGVRLGVFPQTDATIECSKLHDVLEHALGSLRATKMSLDLAESKLFGAHSCDPEKPCESSELPIDTLAYQLRDLAMTLSKLTASIETRL